MIVHQNILLNPLLYVAIGFLAASITAVRLGFEGEIKKRREAGGESILVWLFYRLTDTAMTAAALFILFLIIAFPITLAMLWPHVESALSNPLWHALGLIFLLVLALAITVVRQLFLQAYGVTQIAVGMAIAWGALSSPSVQGGSLLQGVVLAGSVYALVEGMGNLLEKPLSGIKGRA